MFSKNWVQPALKIESHSYPRILRVCSQAQLSASAGNSVKELQWMGVGGGQYQLCAHPGCIGCWSGSLLRTKEGSPCRHGGSEPREEGWLQSDISVLLLRVMRLAEWEVYGLCKPALQNFLGVA